MNSLAGQISRQLETLKVLVVDDEPSMRKVTRALLQAIGVRNIYEASDGRKGLEAIRVRAPDIVILDWEMPSPNGPEFVRTVRSPGRFPLPDVPIIMLTAYSERSRVIEAARLGVNEYLLKPVSSTAILARIVRFLPGRAGCCSWAIITGPNRGCAPGSSRKCPIRVSKKYFW